MLLPGLLVPGGPETIIADKGHDAQKRVADIIEEAGRGVVIPSKSNVKKPRESDWHLYIRRHLIENFFARHQQYRANATRYDERARNFLGGIYLAATVVWLN